MKIQITKNDIQKDLLQNNSLAFSLCFSLIPFVVFIGLIIGSVYLFLNETQEWWYMAVGAMIPLAMSVIFIKLFGVTKSLRQRKTIKAQHFYVVKDYCDSVNTRTYESDGPSTEYIWHFMNTDSQIKLTNQYSFAQKNVSNCEYYLVFLQDEKQPLLFYNCNEHEYIQ